MSFVVFKRHLCKQFALFLFQKYILVRQKIVRHIYKWQSSLFIQKICKEFSK